MKRTAHIHGGASSDPDHKDGTDKAAGIAIECLRDGKTAPGAVVKSVEMIEYQKEAILISFLNEQERYKKLAEYIVQLIQDDPSSPKESLHTIVYRIKDELRLIEKIDAPALEKYLEEILGFKVTVRTLTYIERRLDEVGFAEKLHKILQKVFTEDRILEFKAIFRETLNLIPFTNEKERNIDVINALNFAIFDELQGKRVAQEGLRSVLRWRKERSKC